MGFFDKIRRIWHRDNSAETAGFSDGQLDQIQSLLARGTTGRSILSNVMVRASSENQQDRVLQTMVPLCEMWANDSTSSELLVLMSKVDDCYPHLEKMAQAECLSESWLVELTEAVGKAVDGAGSVRDTEVRLGEVMRAVIDEEENS